MGSPSLVDTIVGRCMAVDREFAAILFMCMQFCDLMLSFECPWTSFCLPWEDSGLPLASLGCWSAPLGRLGFRRGSPSGHFGIGSAPFGCRCDHLGQLGLPSRAWADFSLKMDVRFRNHLERLQCLRMEGDLAELSPG